MNQEIERKFLVKHLPQDLDLSSGLPVQQGYLCAESTYEIRVRKMGDKFYLTAKVGSGIQRHEAEVEITQLQFDTFWPLTET